MVVNIPFDKSLLEDALARILADAYLCVETGTVIRNSRRTSNDVADDERLIRFALFGGEFPCTKQNGSWK